MFPDHDPVPSYLADEVRRLRRHAALLLGEPDRVDELVEEVLSADDGRPWLPSPRLRVRLLRRLYQQFHAADDRPSPYRSAWRAAAMERAAVQMEHMADHQEEAQGLDDIAAALDPLPEDQRAAVILVGAEGLSHQDAAAVLDMPVPALRARLIKARRMLRLSFAGRARQAVARYRR